MTHIVKRKAGISEPYDERKLYASIYAICLSVRATHAEAEIIASHVCRDINEWLGDKPEVTSHDIRSYAAKHLARYNPDASYLYLHHYKVS